MHGQARTAVALHKEAQGVEAAEQVCLRLAHRSEVVVTRIGDSPR